MTTARDDILERIRTTDRSAAHESVDRCYRRVGTRSPAERLELFVARVADYRAVVRLVEPAEVANAIAEACTTHGAAALAIPPGLPAGWRPPGIELVEDHGLSPQRLDEIGGVATGCTLGIAETGTIVLSGGDAEGSRALTLVPDLHVCVVTARQIVELVPEAFAVLDPRRPLTLISGPSATSDIELSRVEGVHGPRTLVVVVAAGDH